MAILDQLRFNNCFSQLPEAFYTRQNATPLNNPELVCISQPAAEMIELDTSTNSLDRLCKITSGQDSSPSFAPLAMIYSGHQFGSYNPQLGDGRGLLLGEVETSHQGKWDLHLKGSGTTPYSRFGDGRAVLRSCIREFLCSEAMHHLGIPTTRALCVTTSDTPVYRETEEKGSTLLRLARTHIRFGHFEYFYYTKQHDLLKVLADFAIEQYFPELMNDTDKYLLMFQEIIRKTAQMVAHWQAAGFAHGVMNTDNMSILGETFDYGPFGFQDDFDWNYICNHSDHYGRYAFSQQPDISYWNCGRLAQALLPLIDNTDALQSIIDQYPQLYSSHYTELMTQKLGLTMVEDEDPELVKNLLQLLQDEHCDYTLFFRALCSFAPNESLPDYLQSLKQAPLESWLSAYAERLKRNLTDDKTRKQLMQQVNPKFILRNYLAQQTIEQAEQGNYQPIADLMQVLESPYDEHAEYEHFASLPPDWGKKLEISCSS
ncbi:hypothetical protein GZ77_17135 [Endozoicomonas montiporae]|uniref:Protein nucleotidyltransferase YdiU n=2 Tax=Endozoicomonas montiporae TaxID=1027273 RepID=A0A081N1G4_9GAMM|nr:YdiU family protein [Endozoicomonas montiporae]AMO58784.1 selenoprotein O and cysteine-containing-like protein [Endozoicomonas montiporae CL-33]KEQ12287.1 hypothetical protein GZ77_17135 [Endozoicomonas montiporae]